MNELPIMVHGQPSWRLDNDCVDAAVTRTGGQLGPVRFRLGDRTIEPLSVAPWAEERHDIPPMLQVLRGDFFALPFGGNEKPWQGEQHPPHGETANETWTVRALEKEGERCTLRLLLKTRARAGLVEKMVQVRPGETAIYQQHVLRMSGPMSFGHHAMLKFPGEPGSGRLSTSRLLYGQVAPEIFEDPAQGGYSLLKTGARFDSLESVPQSDGAVADLTRYPARAGFEDLVMVVHEAAPDFAWWAVTFPEQRYVFYTLKDPRVLRSTVLWHSNGGRHYPPWNGRHRGVLGLEDVTSYFHYGLAESVSSNPVSCSGYATSIALQEEQPLPVNYIFGVAAIPEGFDTVVRIEREHGGIVLNSKAGEVVRACVDPDFLYSGENATQ